jgi:hypothetical protein
MANDSTYDHINVARASTNHHDDRALATQLVHITKQINRNRMDLPRVFSLSIIRTQGRADEPEISEIHGGSDRADILRKR